MHCFATSGLTVTALVGVLVASPVLGQTPQPFPRTGTQQQPAQPTTSKPPTTTAPAQPRTAAQPPSAANAPTAETLGFPIYPGSQFIASYDAGRGQRYYLFGTTTSFTDAVTYYRSQLDTRGNLVYKEPATHMFEVGRFRDETMAFPPGVTVKDFASAGSQGYPNPKLGAQPARFPTIIMIVPAPTVGAAR